MQFRNDVSHGQRNTNFTATITTSVKSTTLLQTARGILCSRFYNGNIRLLFDNCSQRPFVKENLCRKILNGFESDTEEIRNIKVVKAEIRDIHGNMPISVELHVVPKIWSPISQQTIEMAQFTHDHLVGLRLSDSTDGNSNFEIQVLIDGNQYWNFVSGKIIRNFGGPVAMETSFGWVLSGPLNFPTETSSMDLITSSYVMKLGWRVAESVNTEKTIMNKINEFWETENLGLSEIERLALNEFEESISFDEKNYHVRLPRKCDPSILPDNFTMCKSRLKSVLMRLKTDPIRLKEYDDIITKQEADGIIESVNR